MVRYLLRYESSELPLPVGDFVVGRSSECNLCINDNLVSRRHAVFRVGVRQLRIEDLGSRNGLTVNGNPLANSMVVRHLDRVMIGSQELLVLESARQKATRQTHSTLETPTLEFPLFAQHEGPSDDATVLQSASVVHRIVDKALGMGHFDEAARLLEHRLMESVKDAKGGTPISQHQVELLTDYAMKLAVGTQKSRWLDYVFNLHEALHRFIAADVIGQLHEVVRQINYPGGTAFQNYMERMQTGSIDLGPSERFVLRRLEALERVIGA